jgi:hypothetical protein
MIHLSLALYCSISLPILLPDKISVFHRKIACFYSCAVAKILVLQQAPDSLPASYKRQPPGDQHR